MIVIARFFAPFRGGQAVQYKTRPGETADDVARALVEGALALYSAQWPMPAYDRKLMTPVWVSDGLNKVTNNDARPIS